MQDNIFILIVAFATIVNRQGHKLGTHPMQQCKQKRSEFVQFDSDRNESQSTAMSGIKHEPQNHLRGWSVGAILLFARAPYLLQIKIHAKLLTKTAARFANASHIFPAKSKRASKALPRKSSTARNGFFRMRRMRQI